MNDEQITLRYLYVALAAMLSQVFTYREIAEFLYIHGVITQPERPNLSDWGSKKEYALDRLSNSSDNSALLRSLGDFIFFHEYISEGPSTDKIPQIYNLLKTMGYTEEDLHDGVVTKLNPPQDLSAYTPHQSQTTTGSVTETTAPQPAVFNMYGSPARVNVNSQDNSSNTITILDEVQDLRDLIEPLVSHPHHGEAISLLEQLSPTSTPTTIRTNLGTILGWFGDIASIGSLIITILNRHA